MSAPVTLTLTTATDLNVLAPTRAGRVSEIPPTAPKPRPFLADYVSPRSQPNLPVSRVAPDLMAGHLRGMQDGSPAKTPSMGFRGSPAHPNPATPRASSFQMAHSRLVMRQQMSQETSGRPAVPLLRQHSNASVHSVEEDKIQQLRNVRAVIAITVSWNAANLFLYTHNKQ